MFLNGGWHRISDRKEPSLLWAESGNQAGLPGRSGAGWEELDGLRGRGNRWTQVRQEQEDQELKVKMLRFLSEEERRPLR